LVASVRIEHDDRAFGSTALALWRGDLVASVRIERFGNDMVFHVGATDPVTVKDGFEGRAASAGCLTKPAMAGGESDVLSRPPIEGFFTRDAHAPDACYG
jgi:hypothetical protein